MQGYTSANTSINSRKVPAVFKKVPWFKGDVNLDLGGGKYDTATEYLASFGARNLVYDPYNRTRKHNANVLAALMESGGADTCTISNVLNVIDDWRSRLYLIRQAKTWLIRDGILYVTVYEGDRSSIGRQTGKDSWQNNKPLREYLQEVKTVFPNAIIRKGMIIASKEV